MQSFTYNGEKIACKVNGSGFPLVFLHGFCEDQTIWSYFEEKTDLSRYQFISIDFPGFGQTPAIADFSIEDMADLLKELFTHLQLNKAIIYGHSMGGYVALAFLEAYPESVEGIALVHSHPYEDSLEGKRARTRAIEFIRQYGHQKFVSDLIPRLFPQDFRADHPSVVKQLVESARCYSEAGIINAVEAMRARPDRRAVLADTPKPVLFLIGRKDHLLPQDTLLQQTTLPEVAVIHILDNVGHMGIFEQPEDIQQKMTAFATFCLSN